MRVAMVVNLFISEAIWNIGSDRMEMEWQTQSWPLWINREQVEKEPRYNGCLQVGEMGMDLFWSDVGSLNK